MPFSCLHLLSIMCERASEEVPFVPDLRIIAKSSASVSASAPKCSNFSYGLSCSKSSLMLRFRDNKSSVPSLLNLYDSISRTKEQLLTQNNKFVRIFISHLSVCSCNIRMNIKSIVIKQKIKCIYTCTVASILIILP